MIETLHSVQTESDETTIFEVILYPHRSLSPAGFMLTLSVFCSFSLVISVYFFLLGAWPIIGFLGLDMMLIYWAFNANYKSADMQERITLTANAVTVKRTRLNERNQLWVCNPYWVKVLLDKPPTIESQLVLRGNGSDMTLGRFLTIKERLKIAEILEQELKQQTLFGFKKTPTG